MDILIFKDNFLPPIHKRINHKGEIIDLENFQFSIMYETEENRIEEQSKMILKNKKLAQRLIKKKLAKESDNWISKYLHPTI